MASAGSPPRKRKLSRDEREVRGRKKESNRPQSSHRRGKKEGRRESLQVRSVSELAKLVTSGKIRVPKSLVDYVDDRAQLLDQVFTILSPSDIKGMLPDILKGLRMKQVKRLCYDQLKSMDAGEVKQTIQPPVSDWDRGADAALMELLEHEAASPRPEEEQQTVGHVPESCSSPRATPEQGVKDFVIHISDVSGEEGTRETSPNPQEKDQASTAPSCGTSKIEETCTTVVDSDGGQENLKVSSESSATEECWDGGYAVDVPEAAHLLEMELRRRALESELRRANSQQMRHSEDKPLESELSRTGLQSCEDMDTGTAEDVSSEVGSAVREGGGGVDEGVGCGGAVDVGGKVLELKLRERALQSMLARRDRSFK